MTINLQRAGSALSTFMLLVVAGCSEQAVEVPATNAAPPAASAAEETVSGPYQATGMKIGEVTDTGAVIWTRLTRFAQAIGTDAPMPEFLYLVPGEDEPREIQISRPFPHDYVPVVNYPEGHTIETIESQAMGAPGEARVLYRIAGTDNWATTPWAAVDEGRDFTRRFTLTGLEPATDYEIVVEARALSGDVATSTLEGSFGTAPSPDVPARVVFTSVTGTDYEDQDAPEGGFRIHQAMMDLGTDFFVHTGDIIYYYGFAKNIELARWGWARMFSIDSVLNFHRRVPTYFMKDDHDTWQDDTWPTQESLFMGDLTFQDGVEIFKEQMPIDGVTYRTFRWGQDVQIWVVEGRDYRDANMDPDGPDKSIWGEEQKTWFKETVAESDATFRILISPTPLVGPDNPDKWDSHANEIWTYEGNELRQFLADNDMIVICGDRHWQYVSVDDETGLREYATGPASDVHAGGWNQGYRPEHLYLNVVGGFLSVTAERQVGRPTLTLRNHDVDGGVLFEDMLVR